MGTALYSLGPMQGARLWLLFWLAGAVCCLGVCLAVRANRKMCIRDSCCPKRGWCWWRAWETRA